MSTDRERETEQLDSYTGQHESNARTGRWQHCDGGNDNRPSRNQ
jgi:hypothetical protein